MSRISTTEVVAHANRIRTEYATQGLKLTLRQMYYRFVATGLSANGQKEYKRIGQVLTSARYSGDFPVDGLEDRGRESDPGDFSTDQSDVDSALDNAGEALSESPERWLWRSRWLFQPVHVSVWVEKEALSGVIGPESDRLGVSWMACKGYPSVGALDQWLGQVSEACLANDHDRVVVLYFGDHDPDGWQIPRSAEDSIRKLREVSDYGFDQDIAFKRVALNMPQIRRFNPPPFPAKMSSSRYDGYVAEHGTHDAWELDALEPRVLRDLIRDEVNALFVRGIHDENNEAVAQARAEMRERISNPAWARGWVAP